MYLKKVEICGFKSFPEKLEVEFGPGITAVVGPNGCGKTNLADAIRWVLGEQSARQLRGRTMEDVIFNGSEGRKPLGMAEVSMTMGGAANLLPVPYEEVCVTRRVFRSGESEYLLNRKPGRLKDIKDLFADTGVGSDTYSMIEREMIDEVLDERGGARRSFIEEAAGIAKYKDREESARRKLQLTDQDLVRLNDVILELEKRVRSLQYQMGKARRYKRLTERLRVIETARARAEVQSLRARIAEIERELATIGQKREGCRAALSETEAQLEDLGLRRLEHEKRLAEAQERLNEAEKKTEAIEGETLVLRERVKGTRALLARASEERASLEQRADRVRTEGEDASLSLVTLEGRRTAREEERRSLEAEVAELEKQVEQARARLGGNRDQALRVFENRVRRSNELVGLSKNLERLVEERRAILDQVSGLRARVEEVRTEFSNLDEEIRALDEEVGRLEARHGRLEEGQRKHQDRLTRIGSRSISLESKLRSLEEKVGLLRQLEENLEGYESGVRTVLSKRQSEVQGIVADLVSSSRREHATAVEVALSTSLQWIVTSDLRTACDLVEYLRVGRGGVAGFLAIETLQGRQSDGVPMDLLGQPGVVGKAVDSVASSPAVRPVVDFLLGKTVITDNLGTALRLSEEERYRGVTFVTTEGEAIRMPGQIFGGRRAESDPGVTGRRAEIAKAEERTREVRGLLEEVQVFEKRALRARERLSEISQLVAMTLGEKKESRADYQQKQSQLGAEMAHCDRSHQLLAEQLERLETEIRQLEGQRKSAERDVAVLSDEENEASDLTEAAETGLQERETASRGRMARLAAVRAEISALGEEEARLRSREADLVEENQRVAEQIRERTVEISKAEAEIRRCEEALVRMADDLRKASAEVEERRAGRDRLSERGSQFREGESALRQRLRERRNDLEQLSGRAHEIEIEKAKLESAEKSVREQIREKYDVDLEGVELPPDVERVTPEEVEDLKRRIKGLGPVNLVALEEYEEEKQRLDFLIGQRSDLESAKESLEEAIVRIHKTARTRFRETFGEVREKFVETFRTLFEEGEADLRLDDPSDPLRSEISIVARPKGKLERHVGLLSGGERSLTAIAFLVALYLVKPSAFCILDEVDAALDDANVLKFAAMLRRLKGRTQFVVITHNKRSMEVADCLYGVTMSEPGVSRIVSVDLRNRAA